MLRKPVQHIVWTRPPLTKIEQIPGPQLLQPLRGLRHRLQNKDELEPELNLTREVRVALSYRGFCERAERAAGCGVVEPLAGDPVCVEHVEPFGTELERLLLGDSEGLADRHVAVPGRLAQGPR